MSYIAARQQMQAHADAQHATTQARFFQTGPGGYGEGDRFLGLRVPQIRKVARQFRELSRPDVSKLLKSPWHEERLLALVILADQFQRGTESQRTAIYNFYLRHMRWINNWDLVDTSAHKIVGAHLFGQSTPSGQSTKPLDDLACSENFWQRRIAIIATFYFIQHDQFRPTLKIARKTVTRRRRPDPQSSGLDVARSRQAQPAMRRRFPEAALSTDASHDAPLCDRTLSPIAPSGISRQHGLEQTFQQQSYLAHLGLVVESFHWRHMYA